MNELPRVCKCIKLYLSCLATSYALKECWSDCHKAKAFSPWSVPFLPGKQMHCENEWSRCSTIACGIADGWIGQLECCRCCAERCRLRHCSPGCAGIPAPTGSVTALAQMPRTQPPRARHGTTVIDDVPLPICIKFIHTKVSSHSLKEPWLLHRIDWVSTMSLLVREQIRKLEYQ